MISPQPLPGRYSLTRELQLVLACSWFAPDSLKAAQSSKIASLCSEPIDWNLFLSLVERHRLSGVASSILARYAEPLLPPDIKAELKFRKLRDWKIALVYAAELVRLNKLFGGLGVDLLPLKGILLSLRLFGDPAIRHLRDLDLLVRPSDVEQADEVLRAEGYLRVFPELQSTPGRRKLQLKHEPHFEYCRNDIQVRIELHWKWNLLSPPLVSDLWKHSVSMQWQGTTIRSLPDDLLLLALCDHGAGHKFMRLKWLSDCVMLLVDTPATSWNRILTLASQFDMERPLAEVAVLASWVYAIELTEPLAELVRREKSAFRMAGNSIENILAEAPHLKDPQQDLTFLQYAKRAPSQYVKSLWYMASLRKRSRFRAIMGRDGFRSADFHALPLPDRLLWLYYPLRPFLWLWRHANRSKK